MADQVVGELMAVTTRDIGQEVIAALGLQAFKVTGINIQMQHDDLVRIEVSMLPSRDEAIGVFDVLKQYRLVEVGEDILMRADGDTIQDVTAMGDHYRRYARIDATVAVAKQKIAHMAAFARVGAGNDYLAEVMRKCGRYS